VPENPASNRRIEYLAPPIFPDSMYLRLFGGVTHLIFVSTPEPGTENFVIVGDIVATPGFLKQIAEQCLSALRLFDPEASLDEDRIKAMSITLEERLVSMQSGDKEQT
jgi:hypothetical protein